MSLSDAHLIYIFHLLGALITLNEGPLNLYNLEYFKFIAESSSIKFAQEFITFVLQLLFLKRQAVVNAPTAYYCDNCANRLPKTEKENRICES